MGRSGNWIRTWRRGKWKGRGKLKPGIQWPIGSVLAYPFKPLRIFYVFISLYCRGLRGTYVFIVWNHIDARPLLNHFGGGSELLS
jgi:hypothetical protein